MVSHGFVHKSGLIINKWPKHTFPLKYENGGKGLVMRQCYVLLKRAVFHHDGLQPFFFNNHIFCYVLIIPGELGP